MRLYFLLATMFVLVFAACGSSASNANPTAAPTTIVAATTIAPTNTAASGVSSADTPSDQAKAYFAALYSGAATDKFICTGNAKVTDGLKQMAAAVSAGITAGGVKVDTSGLTYETANQTGDSADVKVSGNVKSASAAGTSSEHAFPAQILTMKNDNGWKVCGMGKATS